MELKHKHPYTLPTMREVAAMPFNGHTVVSTFAGCGGSSLGYRMAGFKVLWASEFIKAAVDSYIANKPDYTIVDSGDIRNVSAQSILSAAGLQRGELDVLDGSPPCASFSTSGKREKNWGKVKAYSDTKQCVDDLFLEYVRILDGLQPKVFVAENVSGLIKGTAKGFFVEIVRAMKACGYQVKVRLLNAQWLGVPQSRQRLIFIGTRNDLNIAPVHPQPLPYFYSIKDAIPWITGKSPHPLEKETDMEPRAIGREWDKMKPDGKGSEKYINLVRPHIDKPSPCLVASCGGGTPSLCHPLEKRKFSVLELKRLMSFPEDFRLTGSYRKQVERLGRAVPPVMMKHIADALYEGIFRGHTKTSSR
tara:strand:- start:1874 stop:2959 length:1086 start_codon:yes stop_codon:yes gene_type:complete